MTTNRTTTPNAAMGREFPRSTIFTLIGITLILAFLVVGFAHGAGDSNTPVCDSLNGEAPSEHIISCISSDGKELGMVLTECPFCGENGFDKANDLRACQQFHGIAVTHTEPLSECGIKPSVQPQA
ncbi:MAG: hypothetical protein Q8R70_00175 [Methanoregula sp.]|nr:hypothetical protein [Methanoregula sp.]